MTQQYRLASTDAWLSSTGISHHDLLPHIPWIRLSTVNSCAHPGIAPQSLNASSQPLRLPGDLCPDQGVYGCSKDCLILIHLGGHRSAVSGSALNVSLLTQTITLLWGLDPCFSPPPRAGPVLLTPLFFPLVPSTTEFCVGWPTDLFHWSGPPARLSGHSVCTSVSELCS